MWAPGRAAGRRSQQHALVVALLALLVRSKVSALSSPQIDGIRTMTSAADGPALELSFSGAQEADFFMATCVNQEKRDGDTLLGEHMSLALCKLWGIAKPNGTAHLRCRFSSSRQRWEQRRQSCSPA